MSKHINWIFDTKEQALETIKEHYQHPYVSLSEPIKTGDGRWLLNVTLWECD